MLPERVCGKRALEPSAQASIAAKRDKPTGVSDPGKGAGNVVYDPGLKGLSDSQLHQLPKGFDPKVWAVNPNINNGYPYLLANPPPQ
jgi:hypothetical protein